MKFFLSVSILFFLTLPVYSQTPVFEWAKKTNGGTGEEGGASIVVDGSGNTYTTGSFNGTADFDPGAGVFNMTAAGAGDVFILKLDNNGNFLWAKQIGGPLNEGSASIAVNTTGEIYIAGGFEGTVDFDPGPAIFNLTDFGSGDIFILKLDNNGGFLWAKQLGGTGGDYVNAMAIDNAGNVFATGGIGTAADFDPGPGVYNLTPVSAGDMFISKLNTAGNFAWAVQLAGAGATDYGFGFAIAVDASGNVYSTGNFGGTFDFDPGPGNALITATGSDIYISKLDNAGNFIWAKEFAGVTAFDYGYSYSITTNGSNIYLTGYYNGSMDFDPGPGSQVLSSVGGTDDIFISKLDAGGNYIWIKQLSGADYEYTYSITTDVSGNIYTTGYFSATVDFDPGPGTFNLSSNGGSPDIFISKLDASGNFVWAGKMGGSNFDKGAAITVDAADNVYTTGSFRAIVDFDLGAAVFNLISSGSDDAFVHKMSQAAVLPVQLISFTGSHINNSNRIEWTTAQEINNAYFTLEKSVDGIRFKQLAIIPGAGNSNRQLQYSFEDLSPYNGITYYRLIQTNSDGSHKYSGVIAVSFNNNADRLVALYPNPSTGKISFKYTASEKQVLQFQLINSAGMIIKKGEQAALKGDNIINFPVTNLSSGIYVIRVFNAKGNSLSAVQLIR